MNSISYIFTFIEGILTFISPCILPMLPIYFLYLAGASSEDNHAEVLKKNKLITNSIGFVFGFTLIFVILGATVTTLGHFLVSHRVILKGISGIIIILFGLNFIGIINIAFLNTEKRIDYKFKKLGFLSSIIFGAVFGFSWTPCLGTFLGPALALAGNAKTILNGVLLLFVYSIGLGIPFIISSIIFDQVKGAFRVIQKHTRLINIISGSLLILVGLTFIIDFVLLSLGHPAIFDFQKLFS